jgi:hypothetical protein
MRSPVNSSLQHESNSESRACHSDSCFQIPRGLLSAMALSFANRTVESWMPFRTLCPTYLRSLREISRFNVEQFKRERRESLTHRGEETRGAGSCFG